MNSLYAASRLNNQEITGSGSMPIFEWFRAFLLSALSGGLAACCEGPHHPSTEEMAIYMTQEILQAEADFYTMHDRFGSLPELSLPLLQYQDHYQGYRFSIYVQSEGFILLARPLHWNATGRRAFYADQLGQIHETWKDEIPSEKSPAFQGR